MGAFKRSFINLFFPGFLVLLFVLLYAAFIEYKSRLLKYYLVQENNLKENQNRFENILKNTFSDLNILSESPFIDHFYEDEKTSKIQLLKTFQSFARNRKVYQQIHLMDNSGKDLIYVNMLNYRISKNEKRYKNFIGPECFHDLVSLSPGEGFIGLADFPDKPAIHFGTAYEDSVSGKRIFLVLSYNGTKFFNQVQKHDHGEKVQCFLTDEKGNILSRFLQENQYPDSIDNGLKKPFSIIFPEEWKTITERSLYGYLCDNSGYFSYLKTNLCDLMNEFQDEPAYIHLKPCKTWTFIDFTPRKDVINILILPVAERYGLFLIVGSTFLILITFLYSGKIKRRLFEKEQRLLSFQFLTSLIETLPNPIYYIDFVNNEFDCNQAFETLTGKTRNDLKNLQIGKLFEGQSSNKYTDIKKNKNVKISEIKLKYPDDKIHHLLYYKGQILVENKSIGRVGVFTDISEIKDTEAALRESEEKLQQINRTKDRFFSIIAHDLKNSFHAILGLANLIASNYENIAREDKITIIENIKDSTENTYQLLINLLDWARLQEGKISLKPEDIKITTLVSESIKLLQPKLKEKQLKITTNIECGIRVSADKNMASTVLRNLLNNAIKFTDLGGSIHIACKRKLQFLEISVIDTGTGINPEDQKNLFITDKKSSLVIDNEQGTGLGLILCREFVELNKGKIWVESEPGKGSIFYFTLPLTE